MKPSTIKYLSQLLNSEKKKIIPLESSNEIQP